MAWHDDRQRKLDSASAREVREQTKVARMATARKAYEDGIPLDRITGLARCGLDTLKKWAAEGGWKRGQA